MRCLLIASLCFFMLLLVAVPNVLAYQSFNEDCDDINASMWQTSYNMPALSGGTWVFSFAPSQNIIKQIELIEFTAYGNYTVNMKMPPRVTGCNGWIFLYKDNPWNELDFMEIWGRHGVSISYDVAIYVNGSQNPFSYGYGGGVGYWYPDVESITGINFDDGNYHVWTYIYSDSDLVCYLDTIEFFTWFVDCTNLTALGLPVPPMRLMIGGKGDGTQVSAWSITVDDVIYTKDSEEEAPDPNPPGPVPPLPEPPYVDCELAIRSYYEGVYSGQVVSNHNEDAPISILAIPAYGYDFSRFNVGGVNSYSNPYSFVIEGDTIINIYFTLEEEPPVVPPVSPSGGASFDIYSGVVAIGAVVGVFVFAGVSLVSMFKGKR